MNSTIFTAVIVYSALTGLAIQYITVASESKIKTSFKAELQTLAPVMVDGKCYIVKMPEEK